MDTISFRLPHIANSPEMNDVKFVFNAKTEDEIVIYGHKLILALMSPVFWKMFYSKDTQFTTSVEGGQINMDDHPFNLDQFLHFIKFAYTDKVQQFQLQRLTVDLVIEVMSCADYYDVTHVKKCCAKHLLTAFTKENVISILEAAFLYGEVVLGAMALEFIDRNLEFMMKSEKILHVSPDILFEILKRDSLDIDETFVLDLALMWAEKECERQKLEATAENNRRVLGPSFFEIRFALLPSPRISEIIRSRLLSQEETLEMLLQGRDSGKVMADQDRICPNVLFKSMPRIRGEKSDGIFSDSDLDGEW